MGVPCPKCEKIKNENDFNFKLKFVEKEMWACKKHLIFMMTENYCKYCYRVV